MNNRIVINEKYTLVYDKYCMWIEQTVERKKDGKQETYSKRVSGYHRLLTDLVQSLEERLLRNIGGVETLQAIAEAQAEMREEIRELCKGLQVKLNGE